MNKDKILYERALITCVVMLFVCIILKLFGVQWFNLDTSIPLLNKIDEVVMNNEILSFLYSLFFKYINAYLVCCICLKKTKFRSILLIPLCIISMILSRYCTNSIIILIYDTLFMYVVCFKEVKFTEYILVVFLNIFYQMASLFIRDMNIRCSYYGPTSSLLLMIDYYIMLIITYLYFKKGEKTICGIVRAFGSSLRAKLWKKPTQSSRTCSDKEK